MEETENNNGDEIGGIKIEAKNFYCNRVKDGVNLKEIHKRGERVLFLSMDETNWIADKLLERNCSYGNSNRKETRVFGRRCISLIEGGNQFGCFLSVRLRTGWKEVNYLVVPAGYRGTNWGKLSSFVRSKIGDSISIPRMVDSQRNHREEEVPINLASGRSYRDALQGTKVAEQMVKSNELFEILAILELEVADLRLRLLPSATEADATFHDEAAARVVVLNPNANGLETILGSDHQMQQKQTIEIHLDCSVIETGDLTLPVLHSDISDTPDIPVSSFLGSDVLHTDIPNVGSDTLSVAFSDTSRKEFSEACGDTVITRDDSDLAQISVIQQVIVGSDSAVSVAPCLALVSEYTDGPHLTDGLQFGPVVCFRPEPDGQAFNQTVVVGSADLVFSEPGSAEPVLIESGKTTQVLVLPWHSDLDSVEVDRNTPTVEDPVRIPDKQILFYQEATVVNARLTVLKAQEHLL